MQSFKQNMFNCAATRSTGLSMAVLTVLGLLTWPCASQACSEVDDLEIEDGSMILDCVDVEDEGKLTIKKDGILILTGSGGNNTSTIDGDIELKEGGKLQIVSNDHTFIGSGNIIGEHSDAEIEIADGKTLVNRVTIEGCLKIIGTEGGGTTRFVNDTGGVVTANDDGTLRIEVDALDNGSKRSAGDWQVIGNKASILELATASTQLSGDFTINASNDEARLRILEDITTSGRMDFYEGTIEVYQNKTFQVS